MNVSILLSDDCAYPHKTSVDSTTHVYVFYTVYTFINMVLDETR